MVTTRRPRKTGTTTARREAAQAAKASLLDRLDEFEANGDQDSAVAARIEHFAATYSLRNAMLIVMQNEDATEVHGYREWQKLGRQVRKGEHGIQILAPAGQAGGNQDTDNSAEAPADGQAGTTERIRRFFRLAFVFDIAQTDPIDVQAAA